MTDQEIELKVKEVLSKKFAAPLDRISPTTRLAEDLGVDSFGAIELMFELEESFDLQIPDSEIEQIRTVQDVVGYISGWMAKTAGASPT